MNKNYPDKFNVGVIQMKFGIDPDENLDRASDFIKQAADDGANVICLPELFRSQYFCQSENIDFFELAETVPGPSTGAVSKIAKDKNVVVIVPIFEKRTMGVYHNSAVVINSNGEISGHYRKMHIPDDPSFYEKFYFTPGDLGFKAFDTQFGKLGTLICWDQWYPEGARLTALQGASILFYPTAIGWHPSEKEEHGKQQFESWSTVQRGHAVANGVYVAAANRIGLEKQTEDSDGIEFWGRSFIADPQGVVIAEASQDKEEVIIAEVDLKRIEYIRQNWPFLRDRRIDAYDQITKRVID